MSKQRNITCRFVMTWCITIITVAASGRAESGLPAAGDVVSAYLTMRKWVTRFEAPALDDDAARLAVDGSTGACVILRHRGRVLGTSSESGNDPLLLRRIVGRAMSSVLGDPAVANLPDDRQARVGEGLTLELECAGAFEPLPGRSFARIAEQLEPGIDGVAMRRDDSMRMLFPSRLRATNSVDGIARILPSLAVELGLPARELDELVRRFGIRLYRFRTIHLAQRAPTRRPFDSYRGQVLRARADVSRPSIEKFADGLTNHILTSLWPHGEAIGLMGTYLPHTDQYQPLGAPPIEQALTAFAVARYSTVPGLRDTKAARMRATVLVILRDLAEVIAQESDPLADPAACAAIVYAIETLPQARLEPPIDAMYLRAVEVVTAALAEAPSGHDGALIVGAAALLLNAPASALDIDVVRAAIEEVWASVPGPAHVSLLPWIGWAERDLARAADRSIASVERLRAVRRTIDATRIGGRDRPGPDDLKGGFALTGRGTAVRADAQTARPAAFLATMLRDPDLTSPEERDAMVASHLDTMRFLMQLSVDDSLLWSIQVPQRALGGIRASTWDSAQPNAAQALGLLAAAETLISLDDSENRP